MLDNYKRVIIKYMFIILIIFYISLLYLNRLLPIGIPVDINMNVVDVTDVKHNYTSNYSNEVPVDIIYKDSWDNYKCLTYSCYSQLNNLVKGKCCIIVIKFKNLFSGEYEDRLFWVIDEF